MRAFLGVKIPSEIALQILSALNAQTFKERFSPSDFHITITFLDKIDDSLLDGYVYALSQLNVEPFDVELNGFSSVTAGRGVFGYSVVKDKSKALGNLKNSIDNILKELGVELSAREYKPHISLGYIDEASVDKIHSFNYSTIFRVTSYSLFSSLRELSGGPYVEIHRFELGIRE